MTIRFLSIAACAMAIMLSSPAGAQSAQSRATDKAVETNVNQALERTPAQRKHKAEQHKAEAKAAAQTQPKTDSKAGDDSKGGPNAPRPSP